MQDVATSSPSSRRAAGGGGGGQAGNLRARFENMANAEQEVGVVTLGHVGSHMM